MRAVPATFFFAWFAWFAVHLNSLSASAGERAGERCRSNEFASIREIRVKVFVLIMGSSDPLAWRGGRACHSVRAVPATFFLAWFAVHLNALSASDAVRPFCKPR